MNFPIFRWIKETCDVLDRANEIFAASMACLILILVIATFIANRWAKKHGFPNGKHEK